MRGYTAEEKAWIWLDGIEKLTWRQKEKIAAPAGGPLSVLRGIEERKGELCKALSPEEYDLLKTTLQDKDYFPRVLAELEEKEIVCVTRASADYPELLSRIPAPPHVLYCKGNVGLLKKDKIAVVGSRKTLAWASRLGEEWTQELAKHFVIVTGLAEGGDAAAIRGAKESGNLVCVPAHGTDYVYPAVHTGIFKEVAQRGLVVTEHRPSVAPQKYFFPVRNRIIAGLCRGILVLSAGERSGACITANYGADYGRDVFAVPYAPNIASGKGCNALIKKGAYLADGVEDILSRYGIEEKKEEPPALDSAEEKIVTFLRENGEAHISKIAEAAALPVFAAGGTLSVLEMKGYIVRLGGNRFAAVR